MPPLRVVFTNRIFSIGNFRMVLSSLALVVISVKGTETLAPNLFYHIEIFIHNLQKHTC